VFVGLIIVIKRFGSHRQIKKSVRPLLAIERNVIGGSPVRIYLTNRGLGPAYIEKFNTVVGSLCFAGANCFTDALSRAGLEGSNVIFYTPVYDECLEVNAKSVLLEANPLNEIEHEKICKAISALNFQIKYVSMYGEEFLLSM
jgi:hypothetical protein